MLVVTVPLTELRGMSYQPSLRTEKKNLTGLQSSIAEIGLLSPILIDKHNNIIDGHRRVAVYQALNLATIAAIRYNGEMAGKKPIDAYTHINTTQRKMGALEQLDLYLNGGRVVGDVKRAIEWTEDNLGREFLLELHEKRVSPHYIMRLRNLAHRCSYRSPKELQGFYRWAMKFGQFTLLLTIEKINGDIRCVKNAVKAKRAIAKSVKFT
jgi:hypothetical protein